MIYILTLLYTLYLFYNYDIKKKSTGFKFHYRLLLLISIAVVGFSYRLGMDTTGYMIYFDRVDPNLSYTFRNLIDLRYEPIPELLFSLCKGIWDDFALVQIVIGIFVNVTVFWFLKKHSPMFFFSLFLYFIFQYWNLNFEIKRESIAICVFLIAVDRILKKDAKLKDHLWYYGICTITIFAHRFAFITFLYPLSQYLKFSKYYIAFFVLTTLILAFDSTVVTRTMSSINALVAFSSGESIQHYIESTRFGTGGISIFGTINKVLIPLYLVFNVKKPENEKVYSFTLFYFIVVLLQSQVFIFYRITNYLFYFLFVVYGYLMNDIVEKKSKNSLTKALLIFSIILHIYTLTGKEQHIRYMPYSSIFNKEINQERESTYNDIDLMLNY